MWRFALILGLSAAACGDDGALPPPAGCEPGVVEGTWEDWIFSTTSYAYEPTDLTGVSFSVIEPDGDVIAGTSFVGGFRIEGVTHARPILIERAIEGNAPSYFVTDGCRWDGGGSRYGESIDYATDPATLVSFDVTGLAPWNEQSSIAGLSPRLWDFVWPQRYGAADGATSIMGLTQSEKQWPLLRAASGDVVTLFQSQGRVLEDSETMVSTLVAAGEAPPFDVVDGAETTIDVAMAPLVADRHLTATLDGVAFADAAREVPDVPYPTYHVSIGASPWGACEFGFIDMMSLYPPMNAVSALLEVPFADPFPSEWSRIVCASLDASGGEVDPTGVYRSWWGYLSKRMALDELAGGGRLRPTVSFVTNIHVGGQDALAPAGGVGLAPDVVWDPPSVGGDQITSYTVMLSRRFVHQDGPTTVIDTERVATFRAENPEVQLLEGMLIEGETYVVQITAWGDDAFSTLLTRELTP